MIINMSGGRIDNLKFRVYAATSLSASGKENDVCIITSTPIPSWEVGCVDNPSWSMAAGFVYVTCDASDASQPNLLRKNALYLKLTHCWQYENGTWSSKDAYQYRNGTWVQFSSVNVIPEFTYTGDYEIVNDADETIAVSQDNWKIRFLTSGTLNFQALNGAENGIDAFLVGGGGGGANSGYVNDENPRWGGAGGGGGYTSTAKAITVTTDTDYSITIGAGGSNGGAGARGGETTAFGKSALGGYGGAGKAANGGSGGSGGGKGGKKSNDTGAYSAPGSGGSDGSNSSCGTGKGQGTTTREFGESNGRLYSGGGAGGASSAGGSSSGGAGGGGNQDTAGETNTGGGGGNSKPGGSGIVVIRNKR